MIVLYITIIPLTTLLLHNEKSYKYNLTSYKYSAIIQLVTTNIKIICKMKRFIRIIILNGSVLLLFTVISKFYKCPMYNYFGMCCAGCGMTRACLSALRLDFAQAFEYHPLFFVAIPSVLYLVNRSVLPHRLSDKTEGVIFDIGVCLFVSVYIFRFVGGTLPY